MEILYIFPVLFIVIIVYYGHRLYSRIKEDEKKIWTTCYICHGKGTIRGEGYGTNGVEIWPLDKTCPMCKGKGKVEDISAKYVKDSAEINTVKSKPTRYCPKCHIPMKIKVAKSGKYQGEKFFVCPNFKECKEYYLV